MGALGAPRTVAGPPEASVEGPGSRVDPGGHRNAPQSVMLKKREWLKVQLRPLDASPGMSDVEHLAARLAAEPLVLKHTRAQRRTACAACVEVREHRPVDAGQQDRDTADIEGSHLSRSGNRIFLEHRPPLADTVGLRPLIRTVERLDLQQGGRALGLGNALDLDPGDLRRGFLDRALDRELDRDRR